MRRFLHRPRDRSTALRTNIDANSTHPFQIATYFITHDTVLIHDTDAQEFRNFRYGYNTGYWRKRPEQVHRDRTASIITV